MPAEVHFANEKVKKEFEKLAKEKTEERQLCNELTKAFNKLKGHPTRGIQIPRKQIPQYYFQKYGIKNLWKIDLSKGWRLIYSVESDGYTIVAIILAWMDHQNYDRRFHY